MKKTLGYLFMCLIWGTTWMFIKIGLSDLTPFFSLGLRYLIAGVCLAAFLLAKEGKIVLEKKQIRLMFAITAFNYVIPYALVYWGEQYIYSDLTSVIFACLPLNAAILSLFFLKEENLTLFDFVGILTGFLGVVMIFSEAVRQGEHSSAFGMLAVYLSSLSQALMLIILKRWKASYHPLRINLFPMLATGVIVTGLSLIFEDVQNNHLTLSAVSSVLYLSILGTIIAFALYFWLIPQMKLSLISAMAYIFPVVAIASGYLFLKESLSKSQLLGSFLVLGGVYLTARKQKSRVRCAVS